MPLSVEKIGRTVQQAINDALEELGMTDDEVIIEVLDEGEAGLLGLGRRPAKVRVTADEEPAALVDSSFTGDDSESDGSGYPAEGAYAARRQQLADGNLPEEPADDYFGDDEDAGDQETPEEADTVAYVAAILSGIGIHGKISSFRDGDTLHIDVTGRDCGAAIGRHGETLEAIQYLASLVANKASVERIRVVVDIGGYRRRRENTLINLAERTAEKVSLSGQPINLEPMNPAERRIIHSALQDYPGVTTFSEGEEPERHIVIAPVQET